MNVQNSLVNHCGDSQRCEKITGVAERFPLSPAEVERAGVRGKCIETIDQARVPHHHPTPHPDPLPFRRGEGNDRRRAVLISNLLQVSALLALTVLLCSCVSKSKANARSRTAFAAGQQQGIGQTADARRVNIRFIGPVRQFEVPWQDGLTLAQAIVIADYTEARDPTVIWILRQRERIAVSPRDLLAGKDFPLEPGDTVKMQP